MPGKQTEIDKNFAAPRSEISKMLRILVINPGSTSTRIAMYENEMNIFSDKVEHCPDELKQFKRATDQHDYRIGLVLAVLQEHGINLETIDAVAGRGGLLRPMAGGTYEVNEKMKDDLVNRAREDHASNLGALLADTVAHRAGVPAYIVDPVCTDEMDDVARFSGLPDLENPSFVHALNMRAVARKVCTCLGKPLHECNFVVAHLGSGISVAPLRQGRIVDVNGSTQYGPFSAERCGGLPAMLLVQLCYSGTYTYRQMLDRLMRTGGMFAYLGTKDIREVEARIAGGDQKAALVLEAMAYQIAKEIGAMATVLQGDVDRIIITGGIAYSKFVTDRVTAATRFIAPVEIVPGEQEMEALALGALQVLRGQEKARRYAGD